MSETVANSPNYESRPVLGHLMSGEAVVDRPNSHNHMETGLLSRALGMVDAGERDFLAQEVYMGEEVGQTDCVETADGDEIVYAYRPFREGPTRFVLNKKPQSTEFVSVILKRTEEPKTMVLISAWTGNMAEVEPWDAKATEKSREFWDKHALVWGSQEVDGSRPIVRA